MRASEYSGRQPQGFALIEMMIVVVILAVLVTVALPSYLESNRKSRRSDAMTALLELSSRQERFYAQNGTYTTDIVNFVGLNYGTTVSPKGFYTLTSAACTGGAISRCYLLSAIPQGGQAADTKCASFTLNSRGVKSATGTLGATCW